MKKKDELVVPRGWGKSGKQGDVSKRVQTCIRCIRSEDLMSNMIATVDNTVLCKWNLLKVELKHSQKKKRKKRLNMWGYGNVNSMRGILSQCIKISNHHAVQFNMLNKFICQFYLNEAG